MTDNGNSVGVSWDAHWDESVYGYYVYYREGEFVGADYPFYDGVAWKSGRYNTSHTFSGLAPGTVYSFVVTAVGSFFGDYIESGASSKVFVKTGPPAKPTGLYKVSSKNGAVSLDWTDNSEPDLSFYYVYYGIAGEGFSQYKVASLSSLVISGLENGRKYNFMVRAFDSAYNYSELSAIVEPNVFSYGGTPQWPIHSSDDVEHNRISGTFGELREDVPDRFLAGIEIDPDGYPTARAVLDGEVFEKSLNRVVVRHKDINDPEDSAIFSADKNLLVKNGASFS